MNTVNLQIDKLSKKYKKNQVFTDTSFSAAHGDCIALVGGNGCGKSTFLGMIAGNVQPDSGTIRVTIQDEILPSKKYGEHIAYVPQNNFFLRELSGYDNLLFWYQCDRERMEQDLKNGFIGKLGIQDYLDKRIDKMSVGMQKRIALACALASQPEILLLDEVNAPLDIICKIQIQEFLSDYAKQGNIVILATHDEGDFNICNRICYINNHTINEMEKTSLRDVFIKNNEK